MIEICENIRITLLAYVQKMKVMKAAYCAILIDFCIGSLEASDAKLL